jgi:photoactive yellow protein
MERIVFGQDDIDNVLSAEPERAEFLPFGAICLDPRGNILRYNKAEGLISSRLPKDVIGRNFFNEVAPCSKGRAFHGRFFEAVSKGKVNIIFDYEFNYKMEPTKVRVHMKSNNSADGVWIFIKRI